MEALSTVLTDSGRELSVGLIGKWRRTESAAAGMEARAIFDFDEIENRAILETLRRRRERRKRLWKTQTRPHVLSCALRGPQRVWCDSARQMPSAFLNARLVGQLVCSASAIALHEVCQCQEMALPSKPAFQNQSLTKSKTGGEHSEKFRRLRMPCERWFGVA
jgi:hypothetical protein